MSAATRRFGAIGVFPVVLLISSCTGTGREPSKSGTSTTTLATESSTTLPATSSTRAESFKFVHRDAPPAGVARQVAFFAGAGDTVPECSFAQPLPSKSLPYLVLAADVQQGNQFSPKPDARIKVFDGSEVCLIGFAPNKAVALSVTSPNGVIERHKVVAKESVVELGGAYKSYKYSSGYFFARRPSDPVGKYEILAVQGQRKAVLSVTLETRSEPTLMYNLHEGRIDISGYEREQELALNFYGGRDFASLPKAGKIGEYLLRYLGTMTVRMDVNGQGAYPWPDALKQGCYGVDIRGYSQPKPVQCSE